MLLRYYSNFFSTPFSDYGTMENQSIYYLYHNISSSALRPVMYVPKEYSFYLSKYFDKNTGFKLPAFDSVLKECSFLQVCGRYEDSKKILESYSEYSFEYFYVSAVQDLITLGLNADFEKYFQLFISQDFLSLSNTESLFFIQFGIKCLSFYSNFCFDKDKSSILLEKIRKNITYLNVNAFYLTYFSALLLRYESVIFVKNNNIKQAILLLNKSISLLSNISSVGSYQSFLIKEAKRRILIRLYNISDDLTVLDDLYNIDPFSEEIALLYIQNTSISFDKKVTLLNRGVSLRPIMLDILSNISSDVVFSELLFLEKIHYVSLFGKKIYFPTKKMFLTGGNVAKMIYDPHSSLTIREQLFSPFLLFDHNSFVGNFQKNPVYAHLTLRESDLSFTKSLYLQRNVAYGFHNELLFFFGFPNKQLNHSIEQYYIDEGLSSNNIPSSYWRFFTSLGLHTEVLNSLSFDEILGESGDYYTDPVKMSTLGFLFSRLKPVYNNNNLSTIFDDKMIHSDISFTGVRLKLISVIRLIIYYAKDYYDLSQVEYLVLLGDELMNLLNGEGNISSFEKKLLTSRYYRAKGFWYQMKSDHKGLIGCMKECELYAHLCMEIAVNDKTKSLAIDNLLGCYESMSRTYLYTGNTHLGLSYMKKLLELDSHESKAWIQLGELYFKFGFLDKANKCFANAISLGPPLYIKSWFLLSETYLKQSKLSMWYFSLSQIIEKINIGDGLYDEIYSLAQKYDDKVVLNFLDSH